MSLPRPSTRLRQQQQLPPIPLLRGRPRPRRRRRWGSGASGGRRPTFTPSSGGRKLFEEVLELHRNKHFNPVHFSLDAAKASSNFSGLGRYPRGIRNSHLNFNVLSNFFLYQEGSMLQVLCLCTQERAFAQMLQNKRGGFLYTDQHHREINLCGLIKQFVFIIKGGGARLATDYGI